MSYYKRKKPIFSVIICFVFGLIFSLAGIGVAVNYVGNYIKEQNIIKNGEVIEGTVTNYYVGDIINNVQYYGVYYEYEVDGKTKEGKTGSYYTLTEAENLTTIKLYLYKGEVVGAEAKNSKDVYLAFAGLPFVGFGVLCFVFAVKLTENYFNYTKGLKGGTSTKAKFVRKFSNTRVEEDSVFNIVCKYTKSTGETVEGTAKGYFSYIEACYLEAKGELDISYTDKKFVITEDLSKINYEIDGSAMSVTTKKYDGTIGEDVEYFQCERCDQIVKPNVNGECPICGEKIDKHKEMVDQQNIITCPKCGNKVLKTAKFCNFCGVSMQKNIIKKDEVNNTQSQVAVCPNCNKELSNNAKICTQCGTKIDD